MTTPTPVPLACLADVRADDDRLLSVFAVLRGARPRPGRDGTSLDITLADTTATVSGKVWSDAEHALETLRELPTGSVVKIMFHAGTYQDRLQLTVRNARAAGPDEDGRDDALLLGPGHALVRDLLCRTLVFDIETVPAVARRDLPTTVAESLAKHAERHDSDEAKVMGLSPFFGKVISLAIGEGEVPVEDQRVTVFAVPPDGFDRELPDWIRPVDEAALLEAFWSLAGVADVVVSFNGRGFDVPFVQARSLVHGIGARVDLLGNRYALRPHLDLYRALAGGERVPGPANLDVICWALGIESPKGQMDGSMVAPAYARGEVEEIAIYNAHDVRATTAVYQRVRDRVLAFREAW